MPIDTIAKGSDESTMEELGDSEDEESFHCNLCNKSFSGYIPYLSHLKGAIHAKFLKKEKLKKKMAGRSEILEQEDSPFARCDACHKEFSGPESFAAHLQSTTHTKKASESGEDGELSCETCGKSFSGPIPYRVHMDSKVHRRNLEKAKVSEEMKVICETYDPELGFVCKECKKAFTDPLMFKQHLAHNGHERLKVKNALKEFLLGNPEILLVSPFGEGHEFYLICKLCERSFSGPECAQAHVKSKKHVAAKEKKRMLKLVKDSGADPVQGIDDFELL